MLQRSNMRERQEQAVSYIVSGYHSMILADVGTGKTVISLTALLDLRTAGAFTRTLILAPRRVCTDVWRQEIEEWQHLKDANFTVECAVGMSADKRAQIIEGDSDIVLLNYENLIWLLDNYPKPPFGTLICDEIDKMKDRTTKRFKGHKWRDKVTKEVRSFKGLRYYRRSFDTVIGLTGTPASNHLLDLWAQMFIVDGGISLGTSFNKYMREHFYAADYSGNDIRVLPTHDTLIFDAVKDHVFRIERDVEIPPLVELPPRFVELDKSLLKKYRKFEREYVLMLENDEYVESPHAAAAYGKLRQIASGFVYGETDIEGSQATYKLSSHKFNELDSLIGELQGEQVMIVYAFKEQLRELQKRYPDIEYLGGGVTDSQASATILKWSTGTLQKLAIHPASAGHGLNLQKSGAHHIIMLTQPESAGLLEQVIGRLRRTGNPSPTVFVHRILTRNTIDIEQDAKVHGKLDGQNEFLDEMKKRSE